MKSSLSGSKPAKRPLADLELRLYVTDAAPSSARAIVNTRAFCETHVPGRYDLQILSISEHVAQAVRDEVVAAPTLLRLWPLPVRRFVGDMSNPERLMQGLGLQRKT